MAERRGLVHIRFSPLLPPILHASYFVPSPHLLFIVIAPRSRIQHTRVYVCICKCASVCMYILCLCWLTYSFSFSRVFSLHLRSSVHFCSLPRSTFSSFDRRMLTLRDCLRHFVHYRWILPLNFLKLWWNMKSRSCFRIRELILCVFVSKWTYFRWTTVGVSSLIVTAHEVDLLAALNHNEIRPAVCWIRWMLWVSDYLNLIL